MSSTLANHRRAGHLPGDSREPDAPARRPVVIESERGRRGTSPVRSPGSLSHPTHVVRDTPTGNENSKSDEEVRKVPATLRA
jgi:hypothetical protein